MRGKNTFCEHRKQFVKIFFGALEALWLNFECFNLHEIKLNTAKPKKKQKLQKKKKLLKNHKNNNKKKEHIDYLFRNKHLPLVFLLCVILFCAPINFTAISSVLKFFAVRLCLYTCVVFGVWRVDSWLSCCACKTVWVVFTSFSQPLLFSCLHHAKSRHLHSNSIVKITVFTEFFLQEI